ncbi:MAG TPA: NAD(P)-dependent oxidoreductase, partial [Thermomicrobiales bacterium]|nr:NAD(P)-dependent oxidoreductase [Thermomicrobiales bacterium]
MQIAVGAEINEDRLETLRNRFPDVTFGAVGDEPGIMRDADAYIGRIGPNAYASAGDRLRWVHSTGAGVETILAIPGVVESGIVVTNTRGAHAPFVAEHAFALMLSLVRCLPEYGQDQQDHIFRSFGRGVAMDSLYGKRILVIGMGNIGTAVARRALGFEMHVIGLDLRVPDVISGETPILSIEHLDHELPRADVVVVTVPRTVETEGMLDARRIGLLKDGAIVIGVSRGRIIDEEA